MVEQVTSGISDANPKERPSAALIGLAISVGASSLLLPKQGDDANTISGRYAARRVAQSNPVSSDSAITSETERVALTEDADLTSEVPAIAISEPVDAHLKVEEAIKTLSSYLGKKAPRNRLHPESFAASKNAIPYRVQPGDTLESLAIAYGVSLEDLLNANDLTDADLLEINQILSIPKTRSLPPSERTGEALSNLEKASLADGIHSSAPKAPASSVTSISDYRDRFYVDSLTSEIVRLRERHRQKKHSKHIDSLQSESIAQPLTILPAAAQLSHPIEPTNLELSFEQYIESLQADIHKLRQRQRSGLSQNLASAWETATTVFASYWQAMATTSLASESPSSQINPRTLSPQTPVGLNGYIWPARGELTSGYGWRWGRTHQGIDIAGSIGTPIVAAASGVVTYAAWDESGYGNLVEIQHPDGSLTRYAHNDKLLVPAGQQVERGEKIAEMGSTGYSTNPHCHFEIHLPGQGASDPLAYLPPQ